MKHFTLVFLLGFSSAFPFSGMAQKSPVRSTGVWSLSGRLQLQHVYHAGIPSDAARINQGFRIRRGRLVVKANTSEFIQVLFQIEARDNKPRLKDAAGAVHLANGFYVRFGQFKVPVWREELRSSGKLLLIERSPVASYLAGLNLSARQIGLEIGKRSANGLHWVLNLSNGAGEGQREDAGRSKSDLFLNNGKLFTARLEARPRRRLALGISAALNQVGTRIGATDATGTIRAILPDFHLALPVGANQSLDIEGGLGWGKISGNLADGQEKTFVLLETTARWQQALRHPSRTLAGLEAVEFAAGYAMIHDLRTVSVFRFGPGLRFGKAMRLQVNAEIESGGEDAFKVRSQVMFNF